MTKVKDLKKRCVKISISLDPELVYYLDQLEGDRSSNIAKAIADSRTKHQQISYARLIRERQMKRTDREI